MSIEPRGFEVVCSSSSFPIRSGHLSCLSMRSLLILLTSSHSGMSTRVTSPLQTCISRCPRRASHSQSHPQSRSVWWHAWFTFTVRVNMFFVSLNTCDGSVANEQLVPLRVMNSEVSNLKQSELFDNLHQLHLYHFC